MKVSTYWCTHDLKQKGREKSFILALDKIKHPPPKGGSEPELIGAGVGELPSAACL